MDGAAAVGRTITQGQGKTRKVEIRAAPPRWAPRAVGRRHAPEGGAKRPHPYGAHSFKCDREGATPCARPEIGRLGRKLWQASCDGGRLNPATPPCTKRQNTFSLGRKTCREILANSTWTKKTQGGFQTCPDLRARIAELADGGRREIPGLVREFCALLGSSLKTRRTRRWRRRRGPRRTSWSPSWRASSWSASRQRCRTVRARPGAVKRPRCFP